MLSDPPAKQGRDHRGGGALPAWRASESRQAVAGLVPDGASLPSVITCVVEYVIDPAKIDAFERFAQRWMELVSQHGGTHHGYFLPAEGASDQALALFSFPSLAAYEQYRALFGVDPEFVAADRIRDESGCVLRYQRTFMRPLLPR
jgi:NIPSNAP